MKKNRVLEENEKVLVECGAERYTDDKNEVLENASEC